MEAKTIETESKYAEEQKRKKEKQQEEEAKIEENEKEEREKEEKEITKEPDDSLKMIDINDSSTYNTTNKEEEFVT